MSRNPLNIGDNATYATGSRPHRAYIGDGANPKTAGLALCECGAWSMEYPRPMSMKIAGIIRARYEEHVARTPSASTPGTAEKSVND